MSVSEPDPRARRAAVYRLYSSDGELLYIGSAYDPETRCKRHRNKPWWPQVARRTEEWFEHRLTAYDAETKAIAADRPKHNVAGTPGYTPDSEAVRRRNELNSLRQKLVREADQTGQQVSDALRRQGISFEDAKMTGDAATIDFMEKTGLFAGAVKRRRERLADPLHRDALRFVGDAIGGRTDRLLRLVWGWIAEAETGVGSVETLRAALTDGGFEQPPGRPVDL